MNRRRQITGKLDAAFFAAVGNDILEVKLVDGNVPGFERANFPGVIVHAGYVMPDSGQAATGHQSHISAADYGNFQRNLVVKKRSLRLMKCKLSILTHVA
jgi:hypothetical protein